MSDHGVSSCDLKMANLGEIVEKLTITINELVVRVDKNQQQNEVEWHENKQSVERLWGVVHQMEQDSSSQCKTIQGLQRTVQFHEQKSVAQQGQLNELRTTVHSQEQNALTQQSEVQELKGIVQKLEQVQISQQQEISCLRQQMGRKIHSAESIQESLEKDPQSCLKSSQFSTHTMRRVLFQGNIIPHLWKR